MSGSRSSPCARPPASWPLSRSTPRPICGWLVIDSARGLLTADGGEEDRSDDVRRTLGAIAKWQADHAPGAAVIAIHHMRRDREARTGNRTRGSGDWLAAVDLVVEFDRTATGAKLTYSGRTGAPVAPSFLTWRAGRFTMGRPPDASASGEGASGADMDGTTIVTDRATYDRVLGYLARTPDDWQSSRLRNSWGWRLGAVLNSPGKHPFALDRRLDAGSGGPAARREVEVGLFRRVADRASEHRWVTDAGRAPRGVAGGALVMSPGVRAGRR